MAGGDFGERSRSGLAVASLVCGVIWVFGLGSLFAIVLGHLALRRIRARGGRGRRIAGVGLLLGYLGLLLVLGMLLQGGITIEENVPR